MYCETGQPGLAVEYGTESLARSRRYGHQKYEAEALVALGAAYSLNGRPDLAVDHFTEGVEVARRGGTVHAEIEGLIGQAFVSGRRDLAVEAIAMSGKTGMRLLEAKARTVMAATEIAPGMRDAARESAESALAMHREFGCRLWQAKTLTVLGRFELAHWKEALEIYRAIKSPLANDISALITAAEQP